MTRICMVCGSFPPVADGVASYVYYLSKRLTRRKHQVTVITRGAWKTAGPQKVDGIEVFRPPCWPLYPFHVQIHGLFVNRLLKELMTEFDIVHLHSPLVPIVRTTLPMVVTEHGTAKGFIDNLELKDPFSLVLRTFGSMYTSIDRSVAERADIVTAVSEACVEELRTYYGIDNAIAILNGVDTTFFVPDEQKSREPYVLYVGSLITKKGVPDLIRSAAYLRQGFPRVKFILVGTGPLEGQLKRLVHQLELEENFSFVGCLSHGELRPYYQKAAVCVLPSYHEGLPTTLLEAMSCGKPIVATSVAGNKEAVVDGETGYLVPPRSPEKLAAAIESILSNVELAERMGRHARRRAEQQYDWEVIAAKVDRIYASLSSAM